MELAERESTTSWRDFLVALKQRGLRGVHLVVSDDHADLEQAVAEVLPTALWQCCYVHFMRNALEARADLTAWLARWQDKHPKLCTWVEANIEETFAYYRMPPAHLKHLKSTNLIECLNEEFKGSTHIVRIFPTSRAACA